MQYNIVRTSTLYFICYPALVVTNDIFCQRMFTEYPIEKFIFLHVLLKVSWHVPLLFHMKDYVSYKKKLASFQVSSANFIHTSFIRFFRITKLEKMSNISFYEDFHIVLFQQKMISGDRLFKCYTIWQCSYYFLFVYLPGDLIIFCIACISFSLHFEAIVFY